ncbi:MAG: hypothetical protein ACTTI6_07610 [Treponema sp.]|uniref:hypothetical protein n=1 Tax=Treponema sp. TaxID=166 RepID=UPI003FA3068B
MSTLKENLVQAFQSMKDGDASAFAKKVSEAVASHIKTGNITTVDAGTVPVGGFAGAGTGAMTVDAAILEGVLLAACKSMAAMSAGGNAVLAAQLAAGMDAMTNAGQIKTMITGAAVTPAGVSVPLAGMGKGTFVGVSAPIIAAVNGACSVMETISEGGDSVLAEAIATSITAYLQSGIITVQGLPPLAGSVGSGAMV